MTRIRMISHEKCDLQCGKCLKRCKGVTHIVVLGVLALFLCSGADAYAIRATRIIKVGAGVQNLTVSPAAEARSIRIPEATVCVDPSKVKATLMLRGWGEAPVCQVCYRDGVEDALFSLGLGAKRRKVAMKSGPWTKPMASFPLVDGKYVELDMSRYFQVWQNGTYLVHRDNQTIFRLALNGTVLRYYVA